MLTPTAHSSTTRTDVRIRPGRPADASRLYCLASLDSQRLPTGELLVAEVGGEIVAAHSPGSGRTIADPFRLTRQAVDLLRAHAQSTGPTASKGRRRLLALSRAA